MCAPPCSTRRTALRRVSCDCHRNPRRDHDPAARRRGPPPDRAGHRHLGRLPRPEGHRVGARLVRAAVYRPPYGVRYNSGRSARFQEIPGDDGTVDWPSVLGQWVRPEGTFNGGLAPSRHVYVFGYRPDQLAGPLRLGGTAELVWDKVDLGSGNLAAAWGPSHEPITFGVHVKRASDRQKGAGNLSARLRRGRSSAISAPAGGTPGTRTRSRCRCSPTSSSRPRCAANWSSTPVRLRINRGRRHPRRPPLLPGRDRPGERRTLRPTRRRGRTAGSTDGGVVTALFTLRGVLLTAAASTALLLLGRHLNHGGTR